jgi:hypothetical protein
METQVRNRRSKVVVAPADNAIAKKALEAIQQIEKEAQAKKLAQLDELQSAKAAIHERINDMTHQLKQIDAAIAAILGKDAPAPKKQRDRRELADVRERVGRLMQGRKDQKFGAGELVKEFPELDGVGISMFLKPLIVAGQIKTDVSDGIRRTKYFSAETPG